MKKATSITLSLMFLGARATLSCAQSKTTSSNLAPSKDTPVVDRELFRNGLWLCGDAGNPYSLDADTSEVHRHGIKLSYFILDELAKKHGCERAESNELKPIDLYGDMWKVSDGKNTGLVPTRFYFLYMNFHTVREAESGDSSWSDAWICPKEADAQTLSVDMYTARTDGLRVDGSVLEQLATRNKCVQVNSRNLNPIDVVSGWQRENVQVTDGKNTGWMPDSLYLAYMRSHVVRSR